MSYPQIAYAESTARKLETVGGILGMFGVVGLALVFAGAIPMPFYLGFMFVLGAFLIISSGLIWIFLAIGGLVVALYLMVCLIKYLADKHPSGGKTIYSTQASTSIPNTSNAPTKASLSFLRPICTREQGVVSIILWHGTPSINRAVDILQGHGTWVVGNGNVHGTGVYLASKSTARAYTGVNGALVKVRLSIYSSQIAYEDELLANQNFQTWSTYNPNWVGGDAVTEYVTNTLGKQYLKVDDNMWVALAHKTNNNHLINFSGITALGVFDLNDNKLA